MDFKADVTAGDTHAVINGAITPPLSISTANRHSVSVSGPTLADLYFLTGLVLPHTPPYHMTLTVERDATLYHLNNIQAVLGGTDLGGDLLIDVSQRDSGAVGKNGVPRAGVPGSWAAGRRRQGGAGQISPAGNRAAYRAAAPDKCGGGLHGCRHPLARLPAAPPHHPYQCREWRVESQTPVLQPHPRQYQRRLEGGRAQSRAHHQCGRTHQLRTFMRRLSSKAPATSRSAACWRRARC